jgi:hypothetical protein
MTLPSASTVTRLTMGIFAPSSAIAVFLKAKMLTLAGIFLAWARPSLAWVLGSMTRSSS